MKIVQIIPALTKGGGEKIAVELSNGLHLQGHEVSIVAGYQTDRNLLEYSISPGIKVLFIANSEESRYRSIISWIWKNREWLKSQDLVHSHLTYGSVVGSLIKVFSRFGLLNSIKVVETYHAVGMSIPKLNRWIHSRLVSGRDALVLMARDSFWDLYIRSHQKLFIKIIPNGISIDQVKIWGEGQKFEFKKKCGIEDNNSLVVGTVGMLRPDRQPWRYLPIFKRVLKGFGNNVHFIIAGGGPELERLKHLVKEQGLENNIHFPGLVLDPRLAFSIMDLYISLNVGSITGISVLEAASSGLPVIAIQMLDNYNRKEDDWIWSSTNDDEIAEKIITMLKSKELRDKLAAKQKVYVDQNFSNDRMVNDYLEVYKRVLTRNKGI